MNTLRRILRMLSAAALVPLCACSTPGGIKIDDCDVKPIPNSISANQTVAPALDPEAAQQYADRKGLLKTEPFYHEMVLNPGALVTKLDGAVRHSKLSVDQPFYLLAIEKPERTGAVPKHSCSTGDYALTELKTRNPDAYDNACSDLGDTRFGPFHDLHPMALTHIARFDRINAGVYQKPCFLFDTYHGQFACTDAPGTIFAPGTDLHQDGVMAIDSLKTDLARHLAGATHVVIMSTGWNTHQDESLYNYLDWADRLVAASPAGKPFKPLFIGISWQSKYDKVPTQYSVTTKGNDADEIGLRWTNRLVNDVVMPLADANRIPVVLIGHSYGTRVLGSAIYRRDAIARPILPSSPAAFIALQPAFTINHFTQGREAKFDTATPPNTLVAMTSSHFDGANSLPGKVSIGSHELRYVGGGAAQDYIKSGEAPPEIKSLIKFTSVDGTGHIDGAAITLPNVYLVGADKIVNCRLPGTGPGGGAHDDVYTAEMGEFFWQAITAATH